MTDNQPRGLSRIGEYDVIDELGRGAFGQVLLVEHRRLKKRFAMKVLPALKKRELTPKDRRHFDKEGEIIAKLDHPNIIKVFYSGATEEDDPFFHAAIPYYVMPRMKSNLRKEIEGRKSRPEEAIRLLEPIAQALDYAYEEFRDETGTLHHIIHRDVKPENILIAGDGTLMLSDFGLAVVATRDSLSHIIAGTRVYLPPQCFTDDYYRPSRTQDIYALGVTAYEILCGEVPHSFVGKAIFQSPNYSLPTFESKGLAVDSQLAEVEKVVRQCLAFKPEDRYTTCMEFITALKEASTRRPTTQQPNQVRQVSQQTTSDLWMTGRVSCIATLEHEKGDVVGLSFSPDGRLLASAGGKVGCNVKLWEVGTGNLVRTFDKKDYSAVNSAVFSPDGRLLAVAYGNGLMPERYDHTVKLWEVGTGNLVRTLAGDIGQIKDVAFSPDGRLLAVEYGSSIFSNSQVLNNIELWEPATGKSLLTLAEPAYSEAFSPDGRLLATGANGKVNLWEPRTGKLVCTLSGHTKPVVEVAFSPDGKLLASASDDRTVKLWEVGTGKLVCTLSECPPEAYSVAFSPDKKLLVSGHYETIKLWRPE